MPNKSNYQGVMMGEKATLGIPLVVSDIKNCREMLDGFKNIFFINNMRTNLDARRLVVIKKDLDKSEFAPKNTIQKEIDY